MQIKSFKIQFLVSRFAYFFTFHLTFLFYLLAGHRPKFTNFIKCSEELQELYFVATVLNLEVILSLFPCETKFY